MGEHLLCKQGVSGSIPLISTMRWFVRERLRLLKVAACSLTTE